MIKRKGVTKGDLVRSIKALWRVAQSIDRRIVNVENVLAEYIDYNKDEKKFAKYLDRKVEEIIEDEEKKSKNDKER